MARKTSGQHVISEKLHEAIDGLRKDVTRVEIWATALSTFAQPVPDYRPDPKFELGQPMKAGAVTENKDRNPAETEPRKPPE